MLVSGIGRVRGRCRQRKVIEQVASADVGRRLRYDLRPFHRLTVPE